MRRRAVQRHPRRTRLDHCPVRDRLPLARQDVYTCICTCTHMHITVRNGLPLARPAHMCTYSVYVRPMSISTPGAPKYVYACEFTYTCAYPPLSPIYRAMVVSVMAPALASSPSPDPDPGLSLQTSPLPSPSPHRHAMVIGIIGGFVCARAPLIHTHTQDHMCKDERMRVCGGQTWVARASSCG